MRMPHVYPLRATMRNSPVITAKAPVTAADPVTRIGAQVLLDKLHNLDTERVRLTLARSKPLPFPPGPPRSCVVQATRAPIARADRNAGKRDAWLRLLDRLGPGFGSRLFVTICDILYRLGADLLVQRAGTIVVPGVLTEV